MLGLTPDEFRKLSPLELMKMLDGYEMRKREMLWLASYFTANLMATQIKNVTPEKLMRPFLPQKTKEEKEEERAQFFKDFYAKRKEETAWRQ